MKFFALISLHAILIFASCTSDKKSPLTLSNNDTTVHPIVCTDTVHFSIEIQPIITNSCAITGCHVGHGQGGVDALDYGIFANIQAQDSAIYSRLTMLPSQTGVPGFMPKNASPLSVSQIKSFYCWWKQGALNN